MRQKTVITKLLQRVTEVYYEVCQVLQSVAEIFYKVCQVLQSVVEDFTKCGRFTKCDRSLLQSASGIIKCVRYYKV